MDTYHSLWAHCAKVPILHRLLVLISQSVVYICTSSCGMGTTVCTGYLKQPQAVWTPYVVLPWEQCGIIKVLYIRLSVQTMVIFIAL